jgi:hypothetical protein
MFHTYVARIYSKCFNCFSLMLQCMFSWWQVPSVLSDVAYVSHIYCKCIFYFIHFIRMLHSNVSCCTCFILFRETTDAQSDGGTARLPKNGLRRAGGRRSGQDRGGVRVWDEAGGFESRRTGCAVGARRSVLSGRPNASIARWKWFGGLRILVHT